MDAKVFIQGRVSAEDDKPSKLICEKILPFAGEPVEMVQVKQLWIQFPDRRTYEARVPRLYELLKDADGRDQVVLYLRAERAKKELPPSRSVAVSEELTALLESSSFSGRNVKVVEKIEKRR